MKKYGDTNTNLTLTEKAFAAYSDCDFSIYEDCKNGKYIYEIKVDSKTVCPAMHAEDVNEFFEYLFDLSIK